MPNGCWFGGWLLAVEFFVGMFPTNQLNTTSIHAHNSHAWVIFASLFI